MSTQKNEDPCSSSSIDTETKANHRPSKRGIIYLSSIPPYMNVSQIRETLGQYGTVGRVYLQLLDKDPKRKKKLKKFTEGWVEFDKKCVAKRVAALLNNTQVSTRKKSKHYDYMWNIKYLSNFKWPHLHERLAYERAARSKKLRAEIQLAKNKTNFFTNNLDKKTKSVNKEFENIADIACATAKDLEEETKETRNAFLQSLFS